MTSRHPSTITGRITGINLSSFLQMIEMERKTCTLNVFANKKLGRIFFHNGSIVDADFQGRSPTKPFTISCPGRILSLK